MASSTRRALPTFAVAVALAIGGCGSDADESAAPQRSAINPWPWSVQLGFNQAQLVSGSNRTLHLAGQSAMSPDGVPQHAGDMAAQMELSLDNLEAVLAEAEMTMADVVRLDIYTTDIDQTFANYERIAKRFAASGASPPGSLLGVSRLAFPELLVELQATAQD